MGVWVGESMAGTKQDAISKSAVNDGCNAARLSRIAQVLKDRNKRTAETLNAAEVAENIDKISAFSVLVQILEDILKWDSARIRELFAAHGLAMREWDKIRTDWLTFHDAPRADDQVAPVLAS